jgi:hypothetical protein
LAKKGSPELFILVTDEEAKKASVFVPCKNFQPILIFMVMHLWSTLVAYDPQYPKILD